MSKMKKCDENLLFHQNRPESYYASIQISSEFGQISCIDDHFNLEITNESHSQSPGYHVLGMLECSGHVKKRASTRVDLRYREEKQLLICSVLGQKNEANQPHSILRISEALGIPFA